MRVLRVHIQSMRCLDQALKFSEIKLGTVVSRVWIMDDTSAGMERCYFVLDCKGFLAYNYGPADATKLLLPSTLDEGDPRGFDGDEGILLPIAQGAMGHAGGVARSAWGFLMGRSGNNQGPEVCARLHLDLPPSVCEPCLTLLLEHTSLMWGNLINPLRSGRPVEAQRLELPVYALSLSVQSWMSPL